MFEKAFLQVLSMSFTAGVVIIFLLFARLLLKKAPKIFSYALWGVALFRLVCPFSFESNLSLLGAKAIPDNIAYAQTPQIDAVAPIISYTINATAPAATQASAKPMQIWLAAGTFLWLCGIAALLVYSVGSLALLKRRLRGAVCEGGNIYVSAALSSPFVIGVLRPKIYLPANLTGDEKRYILLHEQTHIKRFDHVFKLAGFFALCLHWFNPLVWAAFLLCGKDMEMSCDEAVIKNLGNEVKKDYSSSLLALATGRRIIGGTPLAFGEGDTKSRIKNVLNYKKPAFWVIIAAAAAVIIVGSSLIANPKEAAYTSDIIYSAKLTDTQKDEIKTSYQLADDSNIFETKFHVSDNIKSYAYYIELYRHGKLLGTYAQNYGSFTDRDGSIISAFSMNRSKNERWESMRWTAGFSDGGYANIPAIPFPDGFIPQGIATSTLTNEGNADEMLQITPEQPVLIANIGMNSAENAEIMSYNCDFLMENPDKIAQYECIYLVKCVFSEKDKAELEQRLAPLTDVDFTSIYLAKHKNEESKEMKEKQALQSRLQGTINSIKEVESSAVRISDDKSSVMVDINLAANMNLSAEQKTAVITLVKNAVGNIAENDIKLNIIDQSDTDADFTAAYMSKLESGEEKAQLKLADNTDINRLSSLLLTGELAGRQSTDDAPNRESYIHISFEDKTGLLHCYVYEDGGKYYLERPYNGIWEISADTLKKIVDMMTERNVPGQERRISFWTKPNASAKNIANAAALAWFKPQLGSNNPPQERITDYNIAKITVDSAEPIAEENRQDMEYHYAVRVDYSLTTETDEFVSPEDGIAGRGTFEGLSRKLNVKEWGYGKFEIVSVEKGGE